MSFIHKMNRSVPISFALVSTDTTQNNTDSPSFANMVAGDPVNGRILIAVIACSDDSVDDDDFWPSTCTIGGVTADKDITVDRGQFGQSLGIGIYSAIVPTGATATVNVTIAFSPGTMDDWAAALFRVTGIDKVPVATGGAFNEVEIDTSLANFVVLGATEKSGPISSFVGGGHLVEAVKHNDMVIAYDDAPLGGATDVYDLTSGGDQHLGAAYG